MNLDEFAEKVSAALGDDLVSFTVYGSAASGETSRHFSDTNTLIVARKLDMPAMKRLAEVVKAWTKKGQPAPTLFTTNRLKRSVDVFPIEIHDMRERHRVIRGEDVLDGLHPSNRNLRFQVEHDLKGRLLRLRNAYLLTENKPKLIAELLARSVSTFQLLFRAALRLYAPDDECSKLAAPEALAKYIEFDAAAFAEAQSLKDDPKRAKDIDCEALFVRVLQAVGIVADAVDALDDES